MSRVCDFRGDKPIIAFPDKQRAAVVDGADVTVFSTSEEKARTGSAPGDLRAASGAHSSIVKKLVMQI